MTMTEIGLLAFGVFLLLLIVLDVGMIVSLVRQGDERRQMIVWKTSTYTLLGASGALVLDIIENLVRSQPMAVNPFIHLASTATIYFVVLMRKERGISQEELAKLCHVSRQTVNAIENNKYDPTLALAFCLARVLGTTVDALFRCE